MVGIPPIYAKIGDGLLLLCKLANSYEFVEPAKGIEREDLNSLQEPPNTPNKNHQISGLRKSRPSWVT
jgi:hypothetical protein